MENLNLFSIDHDFKTNKDFDESSSLSSQEQKIESAAQSLIMLSNARVNIPEKLHKRKIDNLGVEANKKPKIDSSNQGTHSNLTDFWTDNRFIFIEIIKNNPQAYKACYELGNLLTKTEKVQLASGQLLSKMDLYQRTIKIEPKFVEAHIKIAEMFADPRLFSPANNEDTIKAQKIYADVIRLHPNRWETFFSLANILHSNTYMWIFERWMGQKELYLEVIKMRPQHRTAYKKLASILKSGEEIRLNDGRILKRKQ